MLKINNISKRYKKSDSNALTNVSFEIKKGEFVALLGPNGAGKTSLINILAGNVKKDSGSIFIDNINFDKEELRSKKKLGIVPQEISIDFFFKTFELLKNQSGYFGIKNNVEYINYLLDKLSLMDKKNAEPRSLSGGMKRRLMIAKALVHKPRLLILDEPTAGVDIELRQMMYVFLKELNKNGTTIILTTHYLEEAENLCDRIIVINNGKIIADKSKTDFMSTSKYKMQIIFYFNHEIKIENFDFIKEFSPEIKNNKNLLIKVCKEEFGEVFNKVTNKNLDYTDFKITEPKLEDIFLDIIHN